MNISVVLCTYNGSRFVHEQLQSIAQQTRLPDELVVCDDCSQDDTPEIISAFASRLPFSVHFRQNDINLGSTRNFDQAIRLAQGDVIVLSDQDDYWYPNKLAAMDLAFRADSHTGCLFSDADVVDSRGQKLGHTLWQSVRFDQRQQQLINDGDALSVLLRHPVVTGATLAFRSQFRDLVLPIPSSWIHDEWIALLITIASKPALIRQPLMQYRLHSSNQVGAEAVSLFHRLSIALRTDPDIYRRRYEQYGLMRERIAERLPNETSALTEVTEKMEHFLVRAALPDQNWKRIFPVVGEIRRGRYERYSGSKLNPFRDLILKHRGSESTDARG